MRRPGRRRPISVHRPERAAADGGPVRPGPDPPGPAAQHRRRGGHRPGLPDRRRCLRRHRPGVRGGGERTARRAGGGRGRRLLQRHVVRPARCGLPGIGRHLRLRTGTPGPFCGYLAGWGFVVGKTASCAAMALTLRRLRRARPAPAPSLPDGYRRAECGVRQEALGAPSPSGVILLAFGSGGKPRLRSLRPRVQTALDLPYRHLAAHTRCPARAWTASSASRTDVDTASARLRHRDRHPRSTTTLTSSGC